MLSAQAPSIQFLTRNKGVKLPYTGVYIHAWEQKRNDITSYTFDGINSQNDYINATIEYDGWAFVENDFVHDIHPYSFCFFEIEREITTIALN